jgi:hypothetical protein
VNLRWLASVALCFGCSTQDIVLAPAPDVTVIVLEPATDALVEAFASDRDDDQPPDDKQLALSYPAHEVLVPREVPPPTVRWKANMALDGYELELRSAHATVRIYAAEPQAAVPADAYAALLADAGPTEIRVSLRARSSMEPSKVRAAQPLTLSVVDDALPGQIYFWSTGAQGILRAQLKSASASKFFPEPDAASESEPEPQPEPMPMPMPGPAPAANCVGCHTLSRDGTKLAVAYHGERLRGLAMPSRERLYPEAADDQGVDYGWGSFDPAAERLLYAHKGQLALVDATSGAALSEALLPEGVFATHPDWAPDGRHVAVTLLLGTHDKNDAVERSSIARIAVAADGSFGAPEVLVASADDHDTLCFPSYSPDGAFIAYTRASGKSKDQKKAQVWLVPAAGGEPVELERLNRRVGLADGKDLGNHMPSWAPAPAPGSQRYWLTFSSSRPIGEEKLDDKRDQLWLAAIEPESGDADPSWPALWLPFQRLDDSNHRAFWSPSESAACVVEPELCNGQDDDCDDDVDEACCSPEPEICGDGLDNDCDGEREEGCGCALSDLCGNAMDDDCDLRFEEECLD